MASVHRWNFRLWSFRKLCLLYKLRDTVTKTTENEQIAIHKTTANSKINDEHKEGTVQKENNVIDKHAEAIV